MQKLVWYVFLCYIRYFHGLTIVDLTKGAERVKSLYAFRGILDSGARITLGSDFPVEDIYPLKGFYAAITRLSTESTSPHGPDGWCVPLCL